MTNQDAINIIEQFKDDYYFDKNLDEALLMAINCLGRQANVDKYVEPPSKEQLQEDMLTMNNKEIATKYFVSLPLVSNWKRMYDLVPTSFAKRVNDEEFIDIYSSSTTVKEMALDWGVSIHTVNQRAKKLELKRPKRTKRSFMYEAF